MNKTETIAYDLLINNGHTNVVFHPHTTPDFTTDTHSFEVKVLTGNSIIFYAGQFDQLKKYDNVSIMVFRNNKLLHTIPFTDIEDGCLTWQGINIIQLPGNPTATSIRLNKQLLSLMYEHAKKYYPYGLPIHKIIECLLSDSNKYRQSLIRDSNGKFKNTQDLNNYLSKHTVNKES